MNNVLSAMGNDGNAGAVAFGGPQAAPAHFAVGAVGFGPNWQDDEPSLRAMYESACQTIVRLECEAEELRAEVALLREQARIITVERDNWRAAAKQATADRDRNKREWDKCAAELAAVLNGFDDIDAADAEAESMEAAE